MCHCYIKLSFHFVFLFPFITNLMSLSTRTMVATSSPSHRLPLCTCPYASQHTSTSLPLSPLRQGILFLASFFTLISNDACRMMAATVPTSPPIHAGHSVCLLPPQHHHPNTTALPSTSQVHQPCCLHSTPTDATSTCPHSHPPCHPHLDSTAPTPHPPASASTLLSPQHLQTQIMPPAHDPVAGVPAATQPHPHPPPPASTTATFMTPQPPPLPPWHDHRRLHPPR